ncbi:hypothetical protein BO71DRAFT_183408 [Aspergillus ellipticus CBS 707.79]|uniref:Uncharacterized protein n=1 Tax=Aspergillus ellipticus CBS 707.79 TaxID=1448320 RepID=A0A319DG06_9EURO|nr:hypothetical protein BO71DRAFT_183408 [Aspergillus ellipticus CBS 707.79]
MGFFILFLFHKLEFHSRAAQTPTTRRLLGVLRGKGDDEFEEEGDRTGVCGIETLGVKPILSYPQHHKKEMHYLHIYLERMEKGKKCDKEIYFSSLHGFSSLPHSTLRFGPCSTASLLSALLVNE